MALLTGVLLLCSAAVAQTPPANDDIANATVITTLPFTDGPIDTTTATTDPNDPDCVGNGPTVWYVFTPTEDLSVLADAQSNSDYDTTLSVYTGSPGALTQIACSDDRVIFEATGGTTYYFMVGSWASGPGGNLVFHAEVAPPFLDLDLSLNALGVVNPSTGVAVVRGTVSCNTAGDIYYVGGTLQQKKGRSVISVGFGTFAAFRCTPPMVPWSATTSVGPFASGQATVSGLSTCGCNSISCDCPYLPDPITIKLNPKP